MRNAPRQDRSEETIDIILEATAQVLDHPGDPVFTTNHVARRAGVSIGTLYRYFSNKQLILEVLVKREMARRERQVTVFLNENQDIPGRDAIDHITNVTLNAFSGRARVRRYLIKTLHNRIDLADVLHEARLRILTLIEDHLVRVEPRKYRRISTQEKHALLGAWVGCINATMLYAHDEVKSEEFKARLSGLIHYHFRR